MVQALLSLTEVRDAETGRHSRRTQQYTRVLAEQLSTHPAFRDYLTPERIELLASLAPLHDIGKVGVPDRLLNKPGALTARGDRGDAQASRARPRRHRARGAATSACPTMRFSRWPRTSSTPTTKSGMARAIRRAFAARRFRLPGRLMALVDVYDAMTTRRVYREPMSHDDAVAFIVAGRGTQFDPSVVDAFIEIRAW